MSTHDPRGCPVSGSNPIARQAYERALAAFVAWRTDSDDPLAAALEGAPRFVMAHVLAACKLVGSRDPRRVRSARPVLELAAALPANPHERLHIAALERILDDDYEGAAGVLGQALDARPRDVLALSMACGIDYLGGATTRMRERVERVLPAWPDDLTGAHAVRAMHAFALVECGENARAEDAARHAIALEPGNARAHHAMAHVFEMTDRPEAGARWLNAHAALWSERTVVATHCWWHLALFHLASGDAGAVLAHYDRRIRAGGLVDVADLIDAAALLWRLRLKGIDAGARWRELAAAWESHVDDAFCSFNDLHAMLAFVGAGDWSRARCLEQALARRQWLPTRHGESTRQLGLPACRALIAFGRGEHALAISLLASLPAHLHRLGGSHAQRDVLHLTLLQAIESIRRPAPRAQHTKQERPPRDIRLPYALPRLVVPNEVAEATP
ncbi:tetratricopeptide repeat protein [Piscinibacter koreensis]|uniref:Tetratricopeptide repeat protein 38 n=1 Tax=Piscinibacter koreensis TaxID=2742824 RepID=A0A7Y6TYK1_9BURK|nr:tetratricopeptide repeat protein [Schlegelella koreensis]NUZ08328.1 tetratricopeptide repeat protein [Schlegelella koreensis]